MTTYRFLVKTQTSVIVNGQRRTFNSVGEVAEFPEDIGRLIQQRQVSGSEHLDFIGFHPPDDSVIPLSAPTTLTTDELNVNEEEEEEKNIEEEEQSLDADEDKSSGSDDQTIIIPLDANAHWSTVRSFVLDMEQEEQYEMIAAVKAAYDYPKVKEECDRILKKAGRI